MYKFTSLYIRCCRHAPVWEHQLILALVPKENPAHQTDSVRLRCVAAVVLHSDNQPPASSTTGSPRKAQLLPDTTEAIITVKLL